MNYFGVLGIFKPIDSADIPMIVGVFVWMLFCLLVSAICSSSENAFFSHRDSDLKELSEQDGKSQRTILRLLSQPKRLLATMLLMNSLANIAFIISSLFFYDKILNEEVSIPIIASGGVGKIEDFLEVKEKANINAMLAASVFHFNKFTIKETKEFLQKNSIAVRL